MTNKVNEGIYIPNSVDQVIIDGMQEILAGDDTTQSAKLLKLKTIALVESNGNTLNVDDGAVYRIDRQLSPPIIAAALQAGCLPVTYYEKERVRNEFKSTAHVINVYLAVSQANKDNHSDVDDMTWLDRANVVGMTQDSDNIYFLGEPLIHDDVTILRDNPVLEAI